MTSILQCARCGMPPHDYALKLACCCHHALRRTCPCHCTHTVDLDSPGTCKHVHQRTCSHSRLAVARVCRMACPILVLHAVPVATMLFNPACSGCLATTIETHWTPTHITHTPHPPTLTRSSPQHTHLRTFTQIYPAARAAAAPRARSPAVAGPPHKSC